MVKFFIERPVFASSIAIIMVLAGLICWAILPVAQFPEITPPQVIVTSTYPGASAQVVADTVTTPLEQQINGVQGMAYMSSVSANDGTSIITITFDVGYPVSIGAVDVQNRVSQAAASLPSIVNQAGITIQKKNPNFALAINLYSPDNSVDPVTISNFAYLQVVDPLKRVPGVSDVTLFGERRYSMRVWLDPDKLAKLGITAVDVQQAIAEQNVQVAAGKLGASPAPAGTAFEMQINALGRLSTPEQFGDIVLRAGTASQATVLLKDVARLELGALQYTTSAYVNDRPAVLVPVFQLPGSNALDMDKAVRARMAELAKTFPKGINWGINYDTNMFVSASMHDVMITLTEALLLVFAVVFLFLQSWRTTLITGIAIPVSLIGTLAVMYAMGFSLNTVSMLGMVLAIGLVVDDAIVVVENVERQLENGLAPLTAAKVAMSEVTGPIIATSAVLGAVFVPVAFLPGVTGRLYNQFALTIAISIAISAFNSLTLSPALCAVLLRHRPPPSFFVFRKFNQGFDWTARTYGRGVRQLAKMRYALLALFAIGIAATAMLYMRLPSGFLPTEDRGYFYVIIQLPDGASLQRTDAMTAKARSVIMKHPAMSNMISLVGLNFLTGSTGSNSAAGFAILKPWEERGPGESVGEVMADLRKELTDLDDGVVVTFDPPSIPGIGQTGGFEFQLEDLTNHGAFALEEATKALIAEAKKQPEIDPNRVFTTYSTTTPQFKYDLDRAKTKLLGLNLPDVFSTLQIFFGSLYVNDFNLFGRTFRVTVQAEKDARSDPTDLSRLYVRNNVGRMVPLSTLGSLQRTIGPDIVPHYNLYNTAKINGQAAPGYSSGQAIAAMQRAAANVLPQDFGYEWTGITYQELKAGSVAVIVFSLALVFVFLFLAAQYESWAMPFMVILAVPLALFGAFGMLYLRGMTIDVFSQVGFVMLIGLAAKNAILIVEFARRRREDGLSVVAAAMDAARLRLRPILMTAFAFIFGVVPLMLAHGAGAASRQSIGTTVFGGMLAATVLSLALVPVFYVVIERLREPRPKRVREPRLRGFEAAPGE
jgi:hydrophobe/amphiphile efflux-1 (HAE1) family protein